MRYTVEFSENALRQLASLPRDIQTRIAAVVPLLAENPIRPKTKKLRGLDLFRYRIGDYRIVYSIEHRILRVLVVRAGHRSSVYRGL